MAEKVAGKKSVEQNNHIRLLRAIVGLLKNADGVASSTETILEDIENFIENNNSIVGSGVNTSDMSGPGDPSFDDSIKLRMTEDDESNGITYVGYSKPDTATSSTEWILEKITTVEGTTIVTRYEYAKDSWDNRNTTAVYH